MRGLVLLLFLSFYFADGTAYGSCRKITVVLAHGIGEVPKAVEPIAAIFQKRNISVKDVLLKGHGGNPADLHSAKLSDWRNDMDVALDQAQSESDVVFAAGFSLGGALAVDASLRRRDVSAVFGYAPALRPAPVFRRMIDIRSRNTGEEWLNPENLNGETPTTDFDRSGVAYSRLSLPALHQWLELTRQLSDQTPSLRIVPTYFTVTMRDQIIDSAHTISWMRARNQLSNIYVIPDERGALHTDVVRPRYSKAGTRIILNDIDHDAMEHQIRRAIDELPN